DMLDDFHRQNNVERFTRICEVLGGGRPVVDRHAGLGRVKLCHLNVCLGRVCTNNFGAKAGQRLAQKAAAAANIEDAQSFEWLCRAWVTAKTCRDLIANIGEANWIELVQRTEFSVRIPPLSCQRGEPLDFAGVDGRSSGLSHNLVSFSAMKSGR